MNESRYKYMLNQVEGLVSEHSDFAPQSMTYEILLVTR